MCVPAADEMEVLLKHLVDLALLRAFVRSIGVAGAAIAASGPRNAAHRDYGKIDLREEKTAGFPLPKPKLPVAVEVLKDGIDDLQGLPGTSDCERDHAARTFAVRS
jgi:hypothetical protein